MQIKGFQASPIDPNTTTVINGCFGEVRLFAFPDTPSDGYPASAEYPIRYSAQLVEDGLCTALRAQGDVHPVAALEALYTSLIKSRRRFASVAALIAAMHQVQQTAAEEFVAAAKGRG